jgi:hypothetical protein
MAVVRIYSHSGVANYTSDSFTTLKQPYIAREVVEAGAEPKSTGAKLTEASSTKLLHVQIEPGRTVAIELNTNARNVPADKDSPRYTGNVIFEATVGCTLSILEVIA